MQSFTRITELREALLSQRQTFRSVGLVPTMGNLHGGHLKLIETAKRNCDYVLCTVFVNPLQFGPSEDLDAYPRTLSQDIESLEQAHCDGVFHPNSQEMYPVGLQAQTKVIVPELGLHHCGQSRPGHFDGVTTVVNKLLNICQPTHAFFGLKDYQQYLVIRKMALDLHLPSEIHGVETHREESGLAMSSRNNYLDSDQRSVAPILYATLVDVADQLKQGHKNFPSLEKMAKETLLKSGMRPDYFSICNANTLLPALSTDTEIVVLAAAYLGKTRLIDNIRKSLS